MKRKHVSNTALDTFLTLHLNKLSSPFSVMDRRQRSLRLSVKEAFWKRKFFCKTLFLKCFRHLLSVLDSDTDQIKHTCLLMCSSMKEIHSRISNPSSKTATVKNKIRRKHGQLEPKDSAIPTVLDPQELLKVLTRFLLHDWLAGADVWKRHQTVRNTRLTSLFEWGPAELTHAEQPVLLL